MAVFKSYFLALRFLFAGLVCFTLLSSTDAVSSSIETPAIIRRCFSALVVELPDRPLNLSRSSPILFNRNWVRLHEQFVRSDIDAPPRLVPNRIAISDRSRFGKTTLGLNLSHWFARRGAVTRYFSADLWSELNESELIEEIKMELMDALSTNDAIPINILVEFAKAKPKSATQLAHAINDAAKKLRQVGSSLFITIDELQNLSRGDDVARRFHDTFVNSLTEPQVVLIYAGRTATEITQNTGSLNQADPTQQIGRFTMHYEDEASINTELKRMSGQYLVDFSKDVAQAIMEATSGSPFEIRKIFEVIFSERQLLTFTRVPIYIDRELIRQAVQVITQDLSQNPTEPNYGYGIFRPIRP